MSDYVLILPTGNQLKFPTKDLLSNYLVWDRVIPRMRLHGGALVDVGACVGGFALAYHDAYPTSPIHLFEPWQQCWSYLNNNVMNLGALLYPLAVGREHDVLKMFSAAIGHTSLIGTGEFIDVNVVPLDEVINFTVDVLKIDTEGFELNVLEGAKNILTNHRPDLIVEHIPASLPNFDHQKDPLFAMIYSYGYGHGKHIVGNDYLFRNAAKYNE